MEPIAYANGSTWDDPAITYGIVFSNFMSKGVFTFRGGTDTLIKKMHEELRANGVDMRRCALVEKILSDEVDGARRVTGVVVNGREIRCKAVLSNSGIKGTVLDLAGREAFSPAFVEEVEKVRINTSSCQVYLGIRKGETIPHVGDLIFTSKAEHFSSDELLDVRTRSRTFSLYYPDTRPGSDRYTVVCSLNGRYTDWKNMSEEVYQVEKKRLVDESIAALEEFIPGVAAKIDHAEAATPRTIEHYTRHPSSFGTKFEGLRCSMDLPKHLPGCHHAGSVGIIMSGWLGSMNYGVIVSNNIDKYLFERRRRGAADAAVAAGAASAVGGS
jgi:phytoene dehydrogenase-like protein